MKRKAWLSAALAVGLSSGIFAQQVQAKAIVLGKGHTPSISSDGRGHMCIVFEGTDEKTGLADVFCSLSDDRGKTWTPRVDVSPTVAVSTRPRVAIEKSGAIDIVWNDTAYGENNPDIFFTRSTDGGRSWSRPANISMTPGASRDPELAIGPDDKIHVVFAETPESDVSARDIYYSSSSDNGKTWLRDSRLENVSKTKADSSEPSIAVGGDGIVHVAWKEENASAIDRPQIFYSRRTEAGWSPDTNVSQNLRYSYHPVIACGADGKVYINWLDRAKVEGSADIWYVGISGGVPLSKPILVTDTGSIANAAQMTADKSDRLAVAWPDKALGTNPTRIRFKLMSHGNSVPSHHSTRIGHTSALQLAPSMVIEGDNLTIAWEERSLLKNPIKVRSFYLPKIAARN